MSDPLPSCNREANLAESSLPHMSTFVEQIGMQLRELEGRFLGVPESLSSIRDALLSSIASKDLSFAIRSLEQLEQTGNNDDLGIHPAPDRKKLYQSGLVSALIKLEWHIENGTFRSCDSSEQQSARKRLQEIALSHNLPLSHSYCEKEQSLRIQPLEEKEFNNFTVTRATDRDSGEAHNILQMRLAPNKDGSSENGFLRPSYSKEEFENFQKEGDLYVAKNDDEVIGFAVATPYNGSAFKVEKMVLLIMANVVEPLRREDTGWRESLNLLRNDGALYLGLLGVRPENQGEGIGKALIEKIREEKGGAAIVATFSESPLKNLAAAEFFRKVGFTLGGVFRLPLRPIEHYDENNIMSYHWLRGFGSRLVILSK